MTRRITRRRTLGLLAGSLTIATGAATMTAGASDHNSGTASVQADPMTAGVSSTHTATITVESAGGSSWNSLVVDYADTGADVSNVGSGDVETLGIDRSDDADGASVDVDASDDLSSVSASNDGTRLRIGLGGNYTPESGDELVAVFGDVQNPPDAGSSEVTLVANEQSAAETATATLEIGSTDGGSDGGDDTTENDTDGSDGETSDQNCAEIQFCDQITSNSSVTIKRASLPEGGYVVVHESEGDIVGHSSYLSSGTHEDVLVELDTEYPGGVTLTAMAHVDADGDESYDSGDGPYTCDGSPVTDIADVSSC